MSAKLASVLTVLSTSITALVILYLLTGPGYTLELAVVSLVALGAWLGFSLRPLPSQDKIVAPYGDDCAGSAGAAGATGHLKMTR